MAKYQLPPLKDEKLFEELTCDLFNFIENTNSYENTDFQTFGRNGQRSEEHTSELQSRPHLVCRLLLEKKNIMKYSSDYCRAELSHPLYTVAPLPRARTPPAAP